MLTHIDSKNQPTMVDVSSKDITQRKAVAITTVILPKDVMAHLEEGEIVTKKGPVFQTAIIAGTMAVKKTSELIPFCHPLLIEGCKVDITVATGGEINIECKVSVNHKTGVEMEALTGASIAALTIYDMCKAMSHNIVISKTCLVEKSGGKSDISRF